jgi:hypothetical protein
LLDPTNTQNVNFYQQNLPSTVLNYFQQKFNDHYLAHYNCNRNGPGCWKPFVPIINRNQINGFAADDFWPTLIPQFDQIQLIIAKFSLLIPVIPGFLGFIA